MVKEWLTSAAIILAPANVVFTALVAFTKTNYRAEANSARLLIIEQDLIIQLREMNTRLSRIEGKLED